MISSAKRWAIWRALFSLAVVGVLLGEDLRVLGVLGVVEEAVDDEAAAVDGEIAEDDHGGVGGRGGPLGELDLGLACRGGLRQSCLLETMSKMPALERSA